LTIAIIVRPLILFLVPCRLRHNLSHFFVADRLHSAQIKSTGKVAAIETLIDLHAAWLPSGWWIGVVGL